MRLHLDYVRGTALVEWADCPSPVPLRRPRLAEWCAWQEAQERLAQDHARAVTAALDGTGDLAMAVDDEWENRAAGLNYALVAHTVTHHLPPIDVGDSTWLALSDRSMTVELLTFWRDYPLSPWVNAADATEVADVDGRELIRSDLPGVAGSAAVLYKALRGVASPVDVDRMELWQIAVLLDLDVGTGTGSAAAAGATTADGRLSGQPILPHGHDDGGRVVRHGSTQTRRWRRAPGLPFLFSAPAAAV